MGEARRKKLLAAKAKKDTGILTLPNGMLVTEELRDHLKSQDWSGPRNLNHDNPDDWTTSECERRQFSGFRVNRIMNRMEGWILGRLAKHISLDKCTPGAFATMHEEMFKTVGSVVDIGDGNATEAQR